MLHKLNKPLKTETLDFIRIAAFKLEDNKYKGSKWVEIWVVIGKITNGVFDQYLNPITGGEEYLYIKLEDHFHPLKPGTKLGKCELCNSWTAENTCFKTACGGRIIPYDGLTRLENTALNSGLILVEFKKVLYDFLSKEVIPNPVSWEEMKILDI